MNLHIDNGQRGPILSRLRSSEIVEEKRRSSIRKGVTMILSRKAAAPESIHLTIREMKRQEPNTSYGKGVRKKQGGEEGKRNHNLNLIYQKGSLHTGSTKTIKKIESTTDGWTL